MLAVRQISSAEHLGFLQARPAASFLQCPSWAAVKQEWGAQRLGWYDDEGTLVGVGLVLLRQVPKVKRFLAYLPEGPVLDWATDDLAGWLDPLVEHLREAGAFGIKMGPPVVRRRWSAATVKAAIAEGTARRLGDVPADVTDEVGERVATALAHAGWRAPSTEEGFAAGQPQYVFQVPLDGRTADELLKGFNQLWRRNIKKAEKAGVEVVQGGYDDLPVWQQLYEVTAERDRFRPRPLSYFQRMWQVLNTEDPNRMRLYFAQHEGETVAAATMLVVGRHVWYSYGASANHKREVRPSNAMQWRMLRDAYALGASVYDLRGISDSLDESDHLFGLIQFKVGTGGQAAEYLGEWDFPLNKLLHKALDIYMSRR